MKRIRSFSTQVSLKNHHKHLLLEPFEFMFGRFSCPKDAHIIPSTARTRLAQLVSLSYIEKVASKSTSHYSVYRLLTTVFRQNPSHHNDLTQKQRSKCALVVCDPDIFYTYDFSFIEADHVLILPDNGHRLPADQQAPKGSYVVRYS